MEIFHGWENCRLRSILKQSMQNVGYQTTPPLLYSKIIRILLNYRAGRNVKKPSNPRQLWSGWDCASTIYCAAFPGVTLDTQQLYHPPTDRAREDAHLVMGWGKLTGSISNVCGQAFTITRYVSVAGGMPVF